MNRPLIFIADFLHALRELDIRSTTQAQAVMRMLSMDSWTDLVDAGSAAPPAPLPAPPEPVTGPAGPPPRIPPGGSVAANSTADPAAEMAPAVATLLDPRPATWPKPNWTTAVSSLPRAEFRAGPPPESLFDPKQERSILGALAAGRIGDDTIDVDRLIATLARGEPLRDLPVRRTWGLRSGLQVLIDQGVGMTPFSVDVERVLVELGRLVPADRLQQAGFVRSPMQEVRIRGRARAPWRPPPPDTAVLLISDLGLRRADVQFDTAGTAEWLEFAESAGRAQVQLRTLIPYPPGRWPPALALPLRCIHWDRRTTAASTRRALAG